MRKMSGIVFLFALILGVLAACGSDDSEASNGNEEEASSGSEGFEDITISVGMTEPESDTSHYYQGALKFGEILEEETDGAVKLQISASGVLGGEREMVEAVQLGTLDMVITSTGPVGNFVPEVYALDFPFLFEDREHAYSILDGEIGDEISSKIEEAGLHNLGWWENGFGNLVHREKPLHEVEDLKGMKIRVMENEIYQSTYNALGANPTPMAFTELSTSLQQGVVDGSDNPVMVLGASKIYEQQKYLTITHHYYSPALQLINPELFNSFSPELQEVIQKAAEEARDFERDFIVNQEGEFLKDMEEYGIEISEDYNADEFKELTESVYEEYNEEYGDIHEQIRN